MKENWKNPQIIRFGEYGILISWKAEIDQKLLYFILSKKNKIINSIHKEILYINNTYNSILIRYKHTIKNFYSEKLHLKQLISEEESPSLPAPRLIHVPVCYADEFAWDLKKVAAQKNMP